MTSDRVALCISKLIKTYGGTRALDSLDMSIPRGAVYGFLGPNGAGKTTTLRILLGLAAATSGHISVFGQNPQTNVSIRSKVGYLPDAPAFYPWMTGEQFLIFAGGMAGLDRPAASRRSAELLELVGLSGVNKRVSGYSRGMKQRLGLAQALVGKPELLLLDEPTSALDPQGRKDVLEIIDTLSSSATVIFSTHILADVERVCDHVGIISKGRMVSESSLGELKQKYQHGVFTIEVTGAVAGHSGQSERGSEASRLAAALSQASWVKESSIDGGRVRLLATSAETARLEIPRLLASGNFSVSAIEEQGPMLEDIFLELVQ